MTEDQLAKLDELVSNLEERPSDHGYTKWEVNWVEDMSKRDREQDISEKQNAIMDQIYDERIKNPKT